MDFRLEPDLRYTSAVKSAWVPIKEGVKEISYVHVLLGTGLLVVGIGVIGLVLIKL